MAVGHTLVVGSIDSPVVVIDLYAIPENMLTAAFLLMSCWP